MSGPDFIVIGAAKAATTSLCVALQYHPQIHIPSRKEINFFSMNDLYARGTDWYHDQFDAPHGALIGEGSVSYTFQDAHPATAARIHAYRPEMKLIYIVREPIGRLISLYLQFQAAGVIGPVSFGEALRTHRALLDSGRYWKQISAYRNYFPDEQIQILFFDDWKQDAAVPLETCCEFLGVDRGLDLLVSRKTQTLGQARDTKALWALRSLPGFAALRDRLPRTLRGSLKSMLKSKIDGVPEITPETQRFLQEELTDDLRQFLTYAGRPDFWSVESSAAGLAA